jgi:hypothetical protein
MVPSSGLAVAASFRRDRKGLALPGDMEHEELQRLGLAAILVVVDLTRAHATCPG